MKFSLVRRLAMRDVRAGEMGLLLIALVVAVGTVTSISLFVDRLQAALLDQSANFLAADRQISSSFPMPEDFRSSASARGLNMVDTMIFPSMVFSDDANQLVAVKAVEMDIRSAANSLLPMSLLLAGRQLRKFRVRVRSG